MKELVILSGRAGKHIAEGITSFLGNKCEFINSNIVDFANKEIFIELEKGIRGRDVFIVNTFNSDPNRDLVETGILIDTAWRSSARRITVVLPIIYGSRQDRKVEPHTPITIQWVAKILEASEANRIVTLSLHTPHSESAFRINIDNISANSIFLPELKKLYEKNKFMIVSPDIGGVSRASYYSNALETDLAFANKIRLKKNNAKVVKFVGDVEDKDCFIVDDIIDTGGSIKAIAEELKSNGAKSIKCLASHLILSDCAKNILDNAPIEEIWGTNSILHCGLSNKFKIFDISNLFGEVILRIHEDRNIGDLMW